jgi:hypothetical protein
MALGQGTGADVACQETRLSDPTRHIDAIKNRPGGDVSRETIHRGGKICG